MRRIILAGAAALALSACQSQAPENAPENAAANAVVDEPADANATDGNMANASDVAAQVAAAPERVRNGTLMRAILDSGAKNCRSVVSSTRLEDQNGAPRWRADCKDNGPSFAVIVQASGDVIVTGPFAPGKPDH